jgi:hypothetical protein
MYIKIDCACIGVIFDSTLVRLIILSTKDGVGLDAFNRCHLEPGFIICYLPSKSLGKSFRDFISKYYGILHVNRFHSEKSIKKNL